MRVDRHRDGGAGVPEQLTHGFDGLPVGQQEAGVGVRRRPAMRYASLIAIALVLPAP